MASLVWPTDLICLQLPASDTPRVAHELYWRTCRTDFSAPGFCTLSLGPDFDSHSFRQLMITLKNEMSAIHESATDRILVYQSAARCDQQVSTKPHLDGGPEENFLMLGYEPSAIDSQIEIVDYSKCAFDMGIHPRDFMARYNPMFRQGYELLRAYVTRLPCFSPRGFQIICINNSSASFSTDRPAWQGTLHTATINSPDESKRRIINSTMIASALRGTVGPVSEDELRDFVSTTSVRRRGYDKTYLEDG